MNPFPLRIGCFDSGVGGLSVLRALRGALPGAALDYVADSLHAPWGEREPGFVLERSRLVTAHLAGRGARLVVVACNTATALAIEALRADWPGLRFVGVEPGIKPALALGRAGRVGVMATPATLASPRFAALRAALDPGGRLHLQPCPGLAARIEQGQADDTDLAALLDRYCGAMREAGVATVVLGCTHYTFVREAIEARMGSGVAIVDTAEAVARQAVRLAGEVAGGIAPVTLATTGDAALLRRLAARWLPFATAVEALGL